MKNNNKINNNKIIEIYKFVIKYKNENEIDKLLNLLNKFELIKNENEIDNISDFIKFELYIEN